MSIHIPHSLSNGGFLSISSSLSTIIMGRQYAGSTDQIVMCLDSKSISSLRLVDRMMECTTNNAFRQIGFSYFTISAAISALNSLYDAITSICGSETRSIAISMSRLER